MTFDKDDCLMALAKVHTDVESYRMVETVIKKYFSMLDHMKKTSLYDVFEYEKRITKAVVEPMDILTYENEKLKKEINKLRRKLNMIEKYKEE